MYPLSIMQKSKIAVTILYGSPGSGKTTLLSHILGSHQERKIAVIVNEFGDAAFLWSQAGKFLQFQQIGRFADPANAKTEIVFIGQNLDHTEIDTLVQTAAYSFAPIGNG